MRWCLVALLALSGCREEATPGDYSGTVEFPDAVVGSLVGGRVLEIEKREGESAARGDVLVRLDPDEWQSALDEAEALAEATARELELLEAGPREEDIAQAKAESARLELLWKVVSLGSRDEEIEAARADVEAADARLIEAKAALERERTLVRQGSSTSEKLEDVIATRTEAAARKAAAEQHLELLKRGARPEEVEAARQAWLAQQQVVRRLEAGSRPEEIAAKKATLEAARARARVARSKLDELVIEAPADCFVQTLDLRPGDLIQPGQPVAVLLLREEPWITVYVPESDLAKVSVGQVATIRPDGHPALEATVTWISRRAEYTPRNVQTRAERTTQVFAVKLTLTGDVSRLKDGMWADVELR
jgi:multidrug resistance efflux pump